MSTNPPEILKKIGEISIPSDSAGSGALNLDIAKNGKFYLVENSGVDAYGNPICQVFSFFRGIDGDSVPLSLCLGLVQIIGQLILERDELQSKLSSAVRTKVD